MEHKPENGQAGVEVTPEMVRAGLEYLWDSGYSDYTSESHRLLIEGIVKRVFRAGGFSVRTRRGHIQVSRTAD